jgi:ribosomal protein S18 acetylase RimI-like enzyme
MNSEVTIREGRETDAEQVWQLIGELAEYERAPDEVITTPDILRRDGFGANPLFSLDVAEAGGVIVGIALCYVRYSTWKGPVLYLEDIVVKESQRGRGIGDLLFRKVLTRTISGNYHSLVWQVLDWNEPAIHFYKKYGAEQSSEWLNMRITAEKATVVLSALPVSQ